jgi:hypothetical protein
MVMQRAGIKRSVCALTYLEYPAMDLWLASHLPIGCKIVRNPKLDIFWLAQNEERLFPVDSKSGYFWTREGTHWGQRKYYKDHDLDLLILGRRRNDGNYVPRNSNLGIHSNRYGINQYSPLRSWSHEMVLAVCWYFYDEYPPYFFWPKGWINGTGPWPGQRFANHDQGWEHVISIDKTIFRYAANFLSSARRYFEKHEKAPKP